MATTVTGPYIPNNFTSPTLSEWEQMKIDFKIKPLSDSGYLGSAIYLTCLGNSLIIAMFLKEKKLRMKPHNLLLLNLAVSDLGISLFGYPWTTASCYAGRYLFGRVGCTIQGFMTFTLAQTDMNTLACLSFYRYINICKPHHMISLMWAYSLVWTVPPLFGWSSYIPEPFGTSCSIDWKNGELTTFPTMFAKSSCLLNPLLYFLTNSAFRQCIWRMLNCKSPINIINVRR
ncbi:rhodopsin, G0-coupled-like [Patella vulgata]|uniref:rhodopsin, G0-coupled-like n=1 Tax=Patella vulgata TaxID=6465 RepID=UPI0024A9AC8B|nr:rhodopsin, G0-coupled-like [Patella vulgata]